MKMSMMRSASPMTPYTAWLPMCSQQARNARMTWPPDLRRGWCLLMARRKIRKPRSEATRCREMDVNGERLPSVNFSRPKRSSTSIRPEGAHFLQRRTKEGADRVSQDALNRRIGVQPMTLRQLLGIDLPIIHAPMAGAQGSSMAIAVSNAGGLGSLPCAMLSLEAMRNELATIKAQTDRPFNVNFFCHTPPTPDIECEAAWKALLSPYYKRYGIDPE